MYMTFAQIDDIRQDDSENYELKLVWDSSRITFIDDKLFMPAKADANIIQTIKPNGFCYHYTQSSLKVNEI